MIDNADTSLLVLNVVDFQNVIWIVLSIDPVKTILRI